MVLISLLTGLINKFIILDHDLDFGCRSGYKAFFGDIWTWFGFRPVYRMVLGLKYQVSRANFRRKLN